MTPRRARVLLGALMALAAVLRFSTLDAQSFWADEAATVNLLRGDLGDVLSGVRDGESTPPLYYALAWVWGQGFGFGEVGLRALSAVFGTLLVPVAWALGVRVGRQGGHAGALAALLVATNPLLVWFSQEARAYALLALLVALSLLTLLRALDAPGRGRLLLWGAVAALALATHYFAAFFVAAEAAWLLAALGLRHLPAAIALPAFAAGALAPLALAQRSADRAGFIREEALSTRMAQIPKQFLAGYDSPAEVLVTALAAAGVATGLVVVGVSIWRSRRSHPPAAVLLVATGFASLLLPVILAGVGSDYVITRNVVAALAVVLVLSGAGLARLGRPFGVAAAASLAVLWTAVVIAVAADPALQRDDWRAPAAALAPVETDARAVVVHPGSGRAAALLYVPRAQPAETLAPTVPLAEISLLAVAPQQGSRRRSAPAVPAAPPAPGFALTGISRGKTWSVARFRAPRAIPVELGSLSTRGAVVLVQRP